MKIALYYRTLKHLKLKQIVWQFRHRLSHMLPKHKKYFEQLPSYIQGHNLELIPFIYKPKSYLGNNRFCFLNIEQDFNGWDDLRQGTLWNYNLNYMDFLLQENISFKEISRWINRFIDETTDDSISWEPYPIALRGINWIKCFAIHHKIIPEEEKQKWDASLYRQYRSLYKNLEYHLLGNHLLEDAYSLFWGGLYFKEDAFYEKAVWLLMEELNEQILPDGAHYELSPMYHEILLDRLLDCINAAKYNHRFIGQENMTSFIEEKAKLMLGWLHSIIYQDGTIPLLNDAAYGIAPDSNKLFAYAKRLDLQESVYPLKESGYRKYHSLHFEMIIDIGNIGPDYIPGHAHADTFNYELRIDEKPFIIDSGISTYNKNERRQYERETQAHNTVHLEGINSSEVWGGFRVGQRAKITYLKEENNRIIARHNGYIQQHIEHERIFELNENNIRILDSLIPASGKKGINIILLYPDIIIEDVNQDVIKTNLASIYFQGTDEVWIEPCEVSFEYNKRIPSKKICLSFKDQMQYEIKYKS